jgi:hypothetical protein
VKACFANAEKGLPAAAYDPKEGGWFRGKKWPHHIPVLLDKAYVLTWDRELRKLMDGYPLEKVRWLEREFAEWCRFTYCRRGGLEVAEKAFDRAAHRARRRMQKAAALKEPKKGDDLTEVTLERVCDLAYVDGGQWGGHNARCGGPSPGPVGYFAENGRRGLPAGVAALVRHVEKETVRLLLCNTNAKPVRVLITGGYYGQHRIKCWNPTGSRRIPPSLNARRMLIELPARGLADLTLWLTRCAYLPSLKPQSEKPRDWRSVPGGPKR